MSEDRHAFWAEPMVSWGVPALPSLRNWDWGCVFSNPHNPRLNNSGASGGPITATLWVPNSVMCQSAAVRASWKGEPFEWNMPSLKPGSLLAIPMSSLGPHARAYNGAVCGFLKKPLTEMECFFQLTQIPRNLKELLLRCQ